MPENVVNSTITKMSSQEAPAMIICGMLLPVPYPVSMSCTILGTTTAGETAASTAPMTAALYVALSWLARGRVRARESACGAVAGERVEGAPAAGAAPRGEDAAAAAHPS